MMIVSSLPVYPVSLVPLFDSTDFSFVSALLERTVKTRIINRLSSTSSTGLRQRFDVFPYRQLWFYSTTAIEKLLVGSHSFAAPAYLGDQSGSSVQVETTNGTPSSPCGKRIQKLFRCEKAQLSSAIRYKNLSTRISKLLSLLTRRSSSVSAVYVGWVLIFGPESRGVAKFGTD